MPFYVLNVQNNQQLLYTILYKITNIDHKNKP